MAYKERLKDETKIVLDAISFASIHLNELGVMATPKAHQVEGVL
ncbi:hypothetical protein TIFTF001_033485 [Ficus carica]|uniref:Uncharacterized protein n=1 Tax=Ficus carica TaxID=3494 RepID=A0AA88J7X5_FICCA|nr:hypothetical protein TIFTF001_033485 [Ficus carica]